MKLSWFARHYKVLPWGYITLMSVILSWQIWHPSLTIPGRFIYWLNIPVIGLCTYFMGKSVGAIDQIKKDILEIQQQRAQAEKRIALLRSPQSIINERIARERSN